MTTEPFNPYQAPSFTDGLAAETDSNDDAVRRNYLSHEAAVRSIGLLFLISGIAIGLTGTLAIGFAVRDNESLHAELPRMAGSFLIIGAGLLPFGVGMSNLQPWVQKPICVLSCFAAVAFPIGTLLGGYILYAATNGKLELVLSAQYRAVIDRTPNVKPRLPWLAWIAFGLAITGTVVAFVFGLKQSSVP